MTSLTHRMSARIPLPTALVPAALLLGIFYLYPLTRLIVQSLLVDGNLSPARYLDLVHTSVFTTIVLRTLRVAVLVTLICLLLGYPLAYTLNRLPPRVAHPLLLLVTIPFLTSVLMRTYAWVVVLGNNGVVNRVLLGAGIISEPLALMHNELGVIIGMVQVQLPLMVLPLYSVMRGIDRSLLLAAQSMGAAPARAFWDVFRPLSAPGTAAGCSLVFVSSLGFFVTPAALGGPGQYLIVQSIETRMNTLADFGAATAQASVLLVSVVGLMLVLRRYLGLSLQASQPGPITVQARAIQTRDERGTRLIALPRDGTNLRLWRAMQEFAMRLLSRIRRPALFALAAGTLIYLVLPMAIVIPLAFSDAQYLAFPPPSYSLRWFISYLQNREWVTSTGLSLLLSGISGALATVLGTLAAFPIVRSRLRAPAATYLFFVSPLVIPHMVIAVALYFVMARTGLVGNPLALVAAYAVLGLPYVIVVMAASLRRFDPTFEPAAASLGASPIRVLTSITIPLLTPAILSAFLFAFLAGFDDVVVALFLGGPETVTLAIRMWEDIRLEISPRIAAVSVTFLVLMFAVNLATRIVPGRWRTDKRQMATVGATDPTS